MSLRAGGWLHANALLLGEKAVLVRGPSGAGKSRLTLALLEAAPMRGIFARLIGDDRVKLTVQGGRLIVRGHPGIAGQIEAYGLGILARSWDAAGVLTLAIDLAGYAESDILPRMPGPDERTIDIAGICVARLALAGGNRFSATENVQRVFSALERE